MFVPNENRRTIIVACCFTIYAFLTLEQLSVTLIDISHDTTLSTVVTVTKPRPLPLINRWQSRGLNRPNKGGYLFFKHIRKAGGTTMYAYLERVMQYHHDLSIQQNSASVCSNNNQQGGVSYYEQESHAMDWRCPQIDDRWSDTLSIIALRHPIERHLSEFFYYGPGDRGRLGELHQSQNYSMEFAEEIRKALPKWIEEGINTTKQTGCVGRFFTENFQTQALAGDTDSLPRPYNGRPESCFPKERLRNRCTSRGCDGPCSYGSSPCRYRGKFSRGGVAIGAKMTDNVQSQRAMEVLESFDVVLLTETFDEIEQAEFVADVFNVPLMNASLTNMEKLNVRIDRFTAKEKSNTYQDILRKTAPELIGLIASHSKFEMELYQHAVKLNAEGIQRWKDEKRWLV